MVYRIELTNRAAKSFRKLPKRAQAKIGPAIDRLAESPRPPGCRVLRSSEHLRIRVGDHRVVYEVKDGVLLVLVILVGDRKNIYEQLKRLGK